MCEKSWVFNSNSLPTYRTCTFAKKAYRTNVPYKCTIPFLIQTRLKKGVPYFLVKIEAYCTVPTYRTVLPSLLLTKQIAHIERGVYSRCDNGLELLELNDYAFLHRCQFAYCANLHTNSQSVLQVVQATQLACTYNDTLGCFPRTLFV